MKYTIEQVAYMTSLSVSTARQYAWKLGVGEKQGNKKLYTRADALKIKNSPITKSTRPRKVVTRKSKAKTTRGKIVRAANKKHK